MHYIQDVTKLADVYQRHHLISRDHCFFIIICKWLAVNIEK